MSEFEHGGVLIAGGGSGLGEAMAEEFLADGYDVVILGRDKDRTAEAADRLGSEYVVADVADAEQVGQAVEDASIATGGLHVVINSAAILNVGNIETTDPLRDQQMLLTNVMGTRNLLSSAGPALVETAKEGEAARYFGIGSVVGPSVDKVMYRGSKEMSSMILNEHAPHLRAQGVGVVDFRPGALESLPKNDAGEKSAQERALGLTAVASQVLAIAHLPREMNVQRYDVTSLQRWAPR